MSRKRAGKIKQFVVEQKPKITIKKNNKKSYTFFILIGIFCLILFLNSFFNLTSKTVYNPDGEYLGEKFYLSGPDPYLNMRTCEQTIIQGRYPYVQPHEGDFDPLLNYPVGLRGSRPPLFNMVAVSSSLILQNFMPQVDALGWSMVFLPAIYGALLVFPIYGIANTLFNRKVGLIAALIVALIPIHIGGSHGSALSLFDHDSFLLLLFTCIFYFVIKSLKEESKASYVYSAFAGLFVGAVYLTWTAAQFIFTLLIICLAVLFVFDVFKSKYDLKLISKFVVIFTVAFFVSLPWIIVHQDDLFGFPFLSLVVSCAMLIFYYTIKRLRIPWIVSMPSLLMIGGCITIFLYMIHLGIIEGTGAIKQLSITLFGEGIYGSKVSLTVAEAHSFGMSRSIMSFGPTIYWLALIGFVLYIYKSHKEKFQTISVFILTIFIVDFWLSTTAGRFLNDLIPTFAIFSAFCIFLVLDKIDFKGMFDGLKRYSGFKKHKAIRLPHVLGVCFVMFLIIIPNSFLTLDAAVPAESKQDIFWQGYQGAFGGSNLKQIYWVDALSWLNEQDIELPDEEKPAFISWWDYGFYEAAVGHHPTVADNYQVGLYAAGNFKLASSEEEAVAVLIIRCIEGTVYRNNGYIPQHVRDVIKKYLPTKISIWDNLHELKTGMKIEETFTMPWRNFISYIEEPESCPSYDTIIAPEYGNTELRKKAENAMYHDCWNLMTHLTDKQITNFYKDIQKATGYQIRYYGTEQYDTQIFGVFTFLTDRGTHGFSTYEDDYFIDLYVDKNTGYRYTIDQVEQWTPDMFENKDLEPTFERKQAIYETLWYKTYYGIGEMSDNRLPTANLRHFKLVYYSPIVILSKYYEGATVNGTVFLGNQPYAGTIVYVFDDYGIPHDRAIVDINGSYSLIAPAGNLSLRVFVSQSLNDLGQVKEVSITEDEGRQLVPYNKTTDFVFDYSYLNLNINTSESNLTLSINSETYGLYREYQFDLNHVFNLTEMVPDSYTLTITNSTGANLYNEYLYVRPGRNKQNVTI